MKKVIVITGGNSGLGKETAKMLLKGNKIIILGKNSKEVRSVSKKFGCDGIVCDITDSKQVKSAFLQIVKKHKRIDCLINCAGIWVTGPIDKNSPEDIKNTILVNTFGTILVASVFVPQMKKQKSGRIINIISQAGLYPKAERSVYNASKWAITGFTKCLQMELTPFKISVVGVYPGLMRTGIFGKAGASMDFSSAMPVSKVAQELKHLVDIDSNLVVKEFGIQSIKQI